MTASSRLMAPIKFMQPVKYGLLLSTLLLLSVLTPLVESSSLAELVHLILLLIAVLACIIAAHQYRRMFWVAVVLGIIAFSDNSFQFFAEGHDVRPSAVLLSSLFFLLLGSIFLHDVLQTNEVNAEQICGALCVYLIIGVVWSYFFGVVLAMNHEAIEFPNHEEPENLPGTLTYFSFVTLTTLGYGDIQPVSPVARTLCWMEAVVGQIYMTVLIARLVGLNLAAHRERERL